MLCITSRIPKIKASWPMHAKILYEVVKDDKLFRSTRFLRNRRSRWIQQLLSDEVCFSPITLDLCTSKFFILFRYVKQIQGVLLPMLMSAACCLAVNSSELMSDPELPHHDFHTVWIQNLRLHSDLNTAFILADWYSLLCYLNVFKDKQCLVTSPMITYPTLTPFQRLFQE